MAEVRLDPNIHEKPYFVLTLTVQKGKYDLTKIPLGAEENWYSFRALEQYIRYIVPILKQFILLGAYDDYSLCVNGFPWASFFEGSSDR